MRKHRTLRQRFADWLRYSVAERIDRDGSPKSAGASFTFETGVGRVWHDQYHGGPGCPVWYLSEEDYRKAHTDAEANEDLGICGCAMYSEQQKGGKHFPDCARGKATSDDEQSPYKTGVCPECGRLVQFAWVDNTMAGGPVERVPGRWVCRNPECKHGEPAATLTITFDNAAGTFKPTGPRYKFGEEKAQ